MPRQYDQIETIAGPELRAHFIAIGAIRPATSPTRRFRNEDRVPVLELDAEGRAAAERNVLAGRGQVETQPSWGLASLLSRRSRSHVVRRGRRFA